MNESLVGRGVRIESNGDPKYQRVIDVETGNQIGFVKDVSWHQGPPNGRSEIHLTTYAHAGVKVDGTVTLHVLLALCPDCKTHHNILEEATDVK